MTECSPQTWTEFSIAAFRKFAVSVSFVAVNMNSIWIYRPNREIIPLWQLCKRDLVFIVCPTNIVPSHGRKRCDLYAYPIMSPHTWNVSSFFFVQDNCVAIMSKYTKSCIRSDLYFRLFNTLTTRSDYPASRLYAGCARMSIIFLRSYVNILHCTSNRLLLFNLS